MSEEHDCGVELQIQSETQHVLFLQSERPLGIDKEISVNKQSICIRITSVLQLHRGANTPIGVRGSPETLSGERHYRVSYRKIKTFVAGEILHLYGTVDNASTRWKVIFYDEQQTRKWMVCLGV